MTLGGLQFYDKNNPVYPLILKILVQTKSTHCDSAAADAIELVHLLDSYSYIHDSLNGVFAHGMT